MSDEKVGIVERFAVALGAFLWPKLEVWLDTKALPAAREELSQKLDELVPDQIDKALPALFEEVGERVEDFVKGFGGGMLGGLFK